MPADRYKREHVQTYTVSKDVRVMVWGAFCGLWKTPLYILERDFESKKHGFSAQSYLDVLNGNEIQIMTEGTLFMHDNAAIHTARVVKEWFFERSVKVID